MVPAGMGFARASESVIPMRIRRRAFPQREGVGGGVGLPRQSDARSASASIEFERQLRVPLAELREAWEGALLAPRER